jgi:hypothetical protein
MQTATERWAFLQLFVVQFLLLTLHCSQIDYEEFVHATVLYCMYTRDEILHCKSASKCYCHGRHALTRYGNVAVAFDTFDPAATGSIGDKELRRLVGMVNDGQSKYSGNINNALAEFDRNKDGVIDFDEFKNMNKRFPMLLFPCFRLQDRMQKATLGDSHWLSLHKRLYDRLKKENYQVCAIDTSSIRGAGVAHSIVTTAEAQRRVACTHSRRGHREASSFGSSRRVPAITLRLVLKNSTTSCE